MLEPWLSGSCRRAVGAVGPGTTVHCRTTVGHPTDCRTVGLLSESLSEHWPLPELSVTVCIWPTMKHECMTPYYWAPLRVDSFFSRASLLFSTMCPHFSYVGVTIFQYVSLRFSHMSASSPGWTSHNGRPPSAGEPRAWTPSAPEWRRPGVVGSGGVPGEHLWPPAAADPAAAAQFWLAAADQLPERATAAQPSSSAKGQFQGDFQRTMLLSML